MLNCLKRLNQYAVSVDAYPYTDIILVVIHLEYPGVPDHTHMNELNQMGVFMCE